MARRCTSTHPTRLSGQRLAARSHKHSSSSHVVVKIAPGERRGIPIESLRIGSSRSTAGRRQELEDSEYYKKARKRERGGLGWDNVPPFIKPSMTLPYPGSSFSFSFVKSHPMSGRTHGRALLHVFGHVHTREGTARCVVRSGVLDGMGHSG